MPLQILLLTGMLAALDPQPAATTLTQTVPHRHAGRPFLSPMGEPFPVRGQGDDTLIDWFQQADSNHDGSLTLAEMQLDADRFFALLDTSHDGEIDPDEITHYEQVIAPDGLGFGGHSLTMTDRDGPAREDGHGGYGRGGGHRGGHGHGGWAGGQSDNMGQGRSRFGLLDLPEPVSAADTDLSRGITHEEFHTAAQLRFQALDVTRQGRLTLEVLESLRPPSPFRPKKDPDAPSGLDANADTGG